MFEPRMPVSMAIWPDAVSGSMLAMKNGDTVRAPLLFHLSTFSMSRYGPPPPGTEDDADVVAVVVSDLETRVRERLPGRGDAHDDVAVGAPDRLEVHPLRAVEVVHLARHLGLIGRRVPARDLLQPTPAVDQVVPRGVDVLADGGDDAETRDGYTAREVWAAHWHG